MKTLKVGIIMDTWKLPIFKRRLDQAGVKYDVHPHAPGYTSVIAYTEDPDALALVARAANKEAAALKGGGGLDIPHAN